MAVFDATALLHFLEPDARPPADPTTGNPVEDAKTRIDFLIETLEGQRETIVVPTPALSEVLVHAGEAGPRYLEILNTSRCFRIESFDQRAAVELAAMTRDAISAGDLRAGTDATRAKLKFDRQIIAIARTRGQSTIYSDDEDIAKLAEPLDLEVVPLHALPMPPEDLQRRLNLNLDDDG
ncbi:MAG: PIN domain-containing protein [Boseongicola sp. SB0676_bin_33]|nr:PIN domain-containing protein [Boseongicola sp. SB0676_bin_33]